MELKGQGAKFVRERNLWPDLVDSDGRFGFMLARKSLTKWSIIKFPKKNHFDVAKWYKNSAVLIEMTLF